MSFWCTSHEVLIIFMPLKYRVCGPHYGHSNIENEILWLIYFNGMWQSMLQFKIYTKKAHVKTRLAYVLNLC